MQAFLRALGLICIAIIIILLSNPTLSLADDTDPTGAKLRALQTAPGFKAILKKHQEKTGKKLTSGSSEWWTLVCGYEVYSTGGVGFAVWYDRAQKDECGNTYEIMQYCVNYSFFCNHYDWHADCLRKKGCPQK